MRTEKKRSYDYADALNATAGGRWKSCRNFKSNSTSAAPARRRGRVQAGACLLELSLDWIVLRASENVHHLLGESHVTLIDEPLGRFVQAQALHDLRNLFSRLSGTTGIGRAYGVRLTDEPEFVDIAFQLSDGRVLLEAVPVRRQLRRSIRHGRRAHRRARGQSRPGAARRRGATDARTDRL